MPNRGLGQAVRGQHDVDVQFGLTLRSISTTGTTAAPVTANRKGAEVVVRTLGVSAASLIDGRRAGQHRDAMFGNGFHGLLGVERELRIQRRTRLQSRPGLYELKLWKNGFMHGTSRCS